MIELLLCCLSLIIGFFSFRYSISLTVLIIISVVLIILGYFKKDNRYLFVLLVPISYMYTSYTTYQSQLERNINKNIIIYAKIDGKSGSIIKLENKYLRKTGFIKNNKELPYGNYVIIYSIKSIKEDEKFIVLDVKIKNATAYLIL